MGANFGDLNQDFTAKDFRTMRGAVVAAASSARSGPQPKVSTRKRAVSRAMVDASDVVGKTPTIDPERLDSSETEVRALLYREGDVVPLR